MTDATADRAEALRELRADRTRTMSLVAAVDPADLTTSGLGGGAWSPADLLGHLETWEQHALDAIAAWAVGEPPPIAVALDTLGTDEVNRRAVAAKRERAPSEAVAAVTETHRALLAAIEALDEAAWLAVPEAGSGRSVGEHLGSILGGELGLFRHDPDHLQDLEAFAAEHPAP